MARFSLARFSLVPFAPGAAPGATALRVSAGLEGRASKPVLVLDYQLEADLGLGPMAVKLPPAAASPGRRDGLWQHTCLEAFLAPAGERRYWELNLSPSGDWAVYRFSDYRQDGCAEPMAPRTPWSFDHDQRSLTLQVCWPLPAALVEALAVGQGLELGVAAVIERQHGGLEYWALRHPGPEPDFHRREGFQIQL